MKILVFLENNKIVKNYDVIDYRRWDNGQYLNLRIEFIDRSILVLKEYQEKQLRNYSYHWQDENNRLIIRWDNAPHYPNHLSFPHHKHYPDRLAESREISFNEVLHLIEKQIKSKR